MDKINNSYENDLRLVFEKDLPWDELSGQNILVTGATGLIGGCLVDTLMNNPQRNYHVYASGRDKKIEERFCCYARDKYFHFLIYDVLNPLNCDIRFDYIIHAASYASPKFFIENPVEIIKANIDGVIHLLEYGIKHKMKRFLYISSGEIYGESQSELLKEDDSGYVDCLKPRSCYPSSKRAAETLCASYIEEYGVDVVIARPCHVFGPNFSKKDNRVYAQFIRNIIEDSDIIMKSSGEQYRSWCYVVDCVSALLCILLRGKTGHAYNIADKNATITIKELAELIAEIGGKKVKMVVPAESESKGYNVVMRSVFSTEALESLGWSVEGEIKDKFEKTIRHEREKLRRE